MTISSARREDPRLLFLRRIRGLVQATTCGERMLCSSRSIRETVLWSTPIRSRARPGEPRQRAETLQLTGEAPPLLLVSRMRSRAQLTAMNSARGLTPAARSYWPSQRMTSSGRRRPVAGHAAVVVVVEQDHGLASRR